MAFLNRKIKSKEAGYKIWLYVASAGPAPRGTQISCTDISSSHSTRETNKMDWEHQGIRRGWTFFAGWLVGYRQPVLLEARLPALEAGEEKQDVSVQQAGGSMNLKTVASEPSPWPLQTTLTINTAPLHLPVPQTNTPGPESTFLCLNQSWDGSNSKIINKKLKQLTMFFVFSGPH